LPPKVPGSTDSVSEERLCSWVPRVDPKGNLCPDSNRKPGVPWPPSAGGYADLHTLTEGSPMAAILILIFVITLAFALRMMLRQSRPNPVSAILYLLLLIASTGFIGFLFGDVRASYMGENIDRAITQTQARLAAGHCDAVADAYTQAAQARDNGASAHASLGTLNRSLRDIPDAPAETPDPGDTAAP